MSFPSEGFSSERFSSVQEIITVAAQQQVELWFEGESLRYRAPSGGLPAELRASLKERKTEILVALRQQAAQSVQEYPLSYSQLALWFIQQSEPESAAYNVAFTGRIVSPVDLPALCSALQALVDRHPALRTTYRSEHGAPLQQVAGFAPVWFEQVSAAGWGDDQLNQVVQQAYLRPFDMEYGPLLRAHLWTRREAEHFLLINIHHTAVDGWSVWILLDELRALYAANAGGAPANLPRPPAQYSDFVAWQRETLAGAGGEALWKYWQEQLAGELPVLALPTDRPRPPIQTSNGDSENFILPADLTQALKALAKAEGATLYMVLFAAFQTLLHRYSGQTDLIIGSPTFGRSKAEYAKVVGDFINMIPLRMDFSGELTFKEFLARARQVILGGLEHQDFPFPQLVARLGGARDASRSPIFQVTFDVQRLHSFGELAELFIPGRSGAAVDFGGLSVQAYPMSQQEGQFDLSLQMIEVEDILPGSFKYNTDLFDAATIHRLVEHFKRLLAAISANPNQSLAAYPLVTDGERNQILTEWNSTETTYPKACIHQLFELQADKTPEAIAVVDLAGGIAGMKNVSYHELNQRANQLARFLQKAGVRPEMIVGVCLDRSTELIVALLGILKAGGAYLPLDPAYPAERLNFMIRDAEVAVLITQENLADQLPQEGLQLVRMDHDWGTIAKEPAENLEGGAGGENLAYVIYTSGSTGLPKGVLVEHQPLADHCRDMLAYYQTSPQDRVLQFASPNFDASLEQIFTTLICGASLVLRENELWLPMDFSQKISELGLTVVNIPPAYWHQWAHETARSSDRSGIDSLRLVIIGGDTMLGESVKLWQSSPLRAIRLINAYGPTETTITATTYELPTAQEQVAALPRIPIGKPRANRATYILDRNGNLSPVGIVGELYIGGDGLARGYLNRDELNAERFIADPFRRQPGARMYKTGDLARYLPDGNIDFLGRSDFQVKIRGFRIELGEIEAALLRHPAIKEAVVTVRTDTGTDPRLIAYLTTKAEKVSNRELRNFLKERLPIYMVPSAYVFLEAFPLTPSGKINRRALPAPEAEEPAQRKGGAKDQQALHPPQSETELLIAESWRRLLGVSNIDLFDNFFDLGGHSLLAMQVVAEIQEKSGKRLDPAYMRFESLGQLAATLDKISP